MLDDTWADSKKCISIGILVKLAGVVLATWVGQRGWGGCILTGNDCTIFLAPAGKAKFAIGALMVNQIGQVQETFAAVATHERVGITCEDRFVIFRQSKLNIII